MVRVHIAIRKEGETFEEGDAIRDRYNRTIWRYAPCEGSDVHGMTVEVHAIDRPGNVPVGRIGF